MATVTVMLTKVLTGIAMEMKERHLRVDLTDEDIERAKEYADEHGLRMPRAYGDLIREGLN